MNPESSLDENKDGEDITLDQNDSPVLTEPSELNDSATDSETSAEIVKKTPENVRELLDLWRQEYEQSEGEARQELAYWMVKLSEALAVAHLRADQVKIESSQAGIAGFYLPSTGQISITPEGLALPPEHYKGILVHEATHAGITTGQEIHDEGLTEIITQRIAPVGGEGIYEEEQRQTNETFHREKINSIIDTYDLKHPEELFQLYFRTEWELAIEGELHNQITPQVVLNEDGRRAFLDGSAKQWVAEKERLLRLAAPRLVEQAERQGLQFEAIHLKCLADIVQEK